MTGLRSGGATRKVTATMSLRLAGSTSALDSTQVRSFCDAASLQRVAHAATGRWRSLLPPPAAPVSWSVAAAARDERAAIETVEAMSKWRIQEPPGAIPERFEQVPARW